MKEGVIKDNVRKINIFTQLYSILSIKLTWFVCLSEQYDIVLTLLFSEKGGGYVKPF